MTLNLIVRRRSRGCISKWSRDRIGVFPRAPLRGVSAYGFCYNSSCQTERLFAYVIPNFASRNFGAMNWWVCRRNSAILKESFASGRTMTKAMIRVQSTPVLLTFGIIVGLLVAAPRSVNGQAQARVVRIPDAPVCPSCSTILQPIATLGGQEGPGEIHRPPIALREDRLGRFWLLPRANEMPRVYSGKGLKPRYRFTRWSADGKMIADFERDAG